MQFCRLPHSTSIRNSPTPAPQSKDHLFIIYLVPSVSQSFLLMDTSTLCRVCFTNGRKRFREMVGLVEGHVAHKGQSWDLNPYLSPPQPPLGLTMISQSTGCRYQSLRSYKPHPDQKSSTRSPLTFEIHVTITKHLLIQYCAGASQ